MRKWCQGCGAIEIDGRTPSTGPTNFPLAQTVRAVHRAIGKRRNTKFVSGREPSKAKCEDAPARIQLCWINLCASSRPSVMVGENLNGRDLV